MPKTLNTHNIEAFQERQKRKARNYTPSTYPTTPSSSGSRKVTAGKYTKKAKKIKTEEDNAEKSDADNEPRLVRQSSFAKAALQELRDIMAVDKAELSKLKARVIELERDNACLTTKLQVLEKWMEEKQEEVKYYRSQNKVNSPNSNM